MILDQLLEKKDLLAYIKFRTQILDSEIPKIIKHADECDRQGALDKIAGRKAELHRFRTLILQGQVKKQSVDDWTRLHPVKK